MKSIGIKLWKILEYILRFIICKILRINVSENHWDKILQFVKFGIVGVSNSVISYTIYFVCLLVFQKNNLIPDGDYLVAQIVAFFLSVLWSFYWNRKYVFNADNGDVSWPEALLKTHVSYSFTGLFLNSILSILWVQYLGIPKVIAPIANLVIGVPINFVLNKFWAFKKESVASYKRIIRWGALTNIF